MNPSDSEKLARAALKAIAAKSGIKHPVLVHSAEGTLPSSGRRLYLFAATEKDRFNDPAASVVLDETGAEVDVKALGAEARGLFKPKRPGVPAERLEPHKVKIDPPRNDLRLEECDRIVETVTVTIPKSGAVTKADVYFLADTTGSMSSILAAVQAGAANILTALGALGLDLAYGVGNYKDFPSDPFAFSHQLSVTNVEASVQAAIAAWSASGGSDIAEGQLFALDQLAQAPGGSIGWRTGSKRIIVWFGDAPGHDPVCAAISGLGYDITEASATAKLVSEDISVIAISTVTGVPGALDADPVPFSSDYNAACGAPAGAAGQATRIAAATGGLAVSGIDETTIVDTIVALIAAVIGSIDNVSLVPDATIAPFVESITPAGGYGPLAGDEEHVLKFEVVFTTDDVRCTNRDQVFVGALNVVADGAVIAQADPHHHPGLQVRLQRQVRLRHAGRLRMRLRPAASRRLRDRDQHPQLQVPRRQGREMVAAAGAGRCPGRPRAAHLAAAAGRAHPAAGRLGDHGRLLPHHRAAARRARHRTDAAVDRLHGDRQQRRAAGHRRLHRQRRQVRQPQHGCRKRGPAAEVGRAGGSRETASAGSA